ncbi:hypothetical protein E2P81_ATG00484 [Venturia nashicola]|uniref:Peroxidase n=1 Tax=Venturia nashicola TaxID=86259 RepID=A0A4Z1PIJ7_9PEZI|nr:hypothetical protein E6O75_ATG00494 [Venturia nashicola]TLD39497.1 hypothetical protein E2P81_ATG00484 [Venturia nashicola]
MKFTTSALSAMLSASAMAYPGMGGDASAFHKRMAEVSTKEKRDLPPSLDSATSQVAQDIKDCLSTATSCEASDTAKTYVAPALGSKECAADQCCIWDYVTSDLVAIFKDCDGQCTEAARQSIRLGFHDAGAWSLASGFGGADGSMLISGNEKDRVENNGLQEIIATLQTMWGKYKGNGVGAADLMQHAAVVATVVCPLGPRTRAFVGRKDGDGSSPNGLLPDVHSDADTLIKLFEDKTISAFDLAALVGAHSTSEQDVVDANFAGAPQDSTPGVWDVAFYSETPDQNASSAIFKFPSDQALAADPRTKPSFDFFGKNVNGQAAWNDDFARAYVRLSLLGVPNIDDLVECTKVLPSQIGSFVIAPNSCKAGNNTSSVSSSAPSSATSGAPYASSNTTGIYSHPASSAKTTSYVTKYTTSTKTTTKTHIITNKGSVTKSYEALTTTTVCPIVPSRVLTYEPTETITKSVPKGFFAGPNGESYVFKPVITPGPSYSLTYASCKPKTVYTTVTVY